MSKEFFAIFRCDASKSIGSGHLLRCITLANFLKKEGLKSLFVCIDIDPYFLTIIEKNSHKCLNFDFQNKISFKSEFLDNFLNYDWYKDSQFTIKIINELKTEWVIIDNYLLDFKWENLVRKYTKNIMAIDDLANRKHNCDILLDQNFVNNFYTRYDFLVPKNCIKLLGPNYAVVKEDFVKAREISKFRNKINKILIYFGSTDKYNLVLKTIKKIIERFNDNFKLYVVLSISSLFNQEIKDYCKNFDNIFVIEWVESLANLMIEADICIGAVGSVTWERCCLKLPSIVTSVAENQKEIALKLSEEKVLLWVGDQSENTANEIILNLEKLHNNSKLQGEISRNCSDLVDGNGTKRIVSNIINYNSL